MAEHRWRGYEHTELYRMINSGPGPSASTPQTEYWESLMAELGEIDGDLNSQLNTLNASWQGQAAEGAQGALNPLQLWASEAQGGASGMRASTEYQADMIARARAEVPEPVKVTTPAPSGWSKVAAGAAMLGGNPGPAMAVANQAADHEAQERAKDEAAEKAVDAMDSYSRSSEFNRNTLGEFTPPPDVVVSTPAPQGGQSAGVTHFTSATGGYTTGGGGTTAPSYAGVSPTGSGGGYTPVTGGGQWTPGPVGGPGGANPPGYVPPGQTVPGQVIPGTPGGPGSPAYAGPGGTTPGGPFPGPLAGGAGARPSEGGARVRGGGGAGGFGGRGGMGALGPVGVEAESTRGNQLMRPGLGLAAGEAGMGARGGVVGVPAGGGGRGGAGMGMASPVGGSADGDEDREHGLADYLIETVDVFGDERIVSQPVIGDDQDR